jgi:myo-inositol catabolism protein IolC
MASLDRVDSTKGYIVGNIQFISAAANMAKNNMTHEQMIEFCKIIADNWNKK